MMSESSSRLRPRVWKACVCGVAIVGASFGGVAAGAAAPTVPGAPTITSVTAEDHAIKVAFTKPSNGGSPIFNYKATCTSSTGGVTRSASNFRSAVFVDGLTAGDTYTCTVMAENRAGFGPPSAPSGPVVVLPILPDAPTITSVTAEDHAIKVAFTKPSNGGSPIFNYKATCTSSNGGVTRSASNFRSAVFVDGLTAGDTYTCTVTAKNNAGTGPPSAPSSPVVVLPVLPDAPTITSVTAEDHAIKVAFTKPSSNGGSPIFNYKATCTSSNGGVTRSLAELRFTIDVVGLSAGKTYTCTVTAKNNAGAGPPSAPSGPVVVLPILPDAPTITSVTAE
ncbi:MAG: fibronectin type III domain-containing protein, partial [Acidimicrobiia bacterium]